MRSYKKRELNEVEVTQFEENNGCYDLTSKFIQVPVDDQSYSKPKKAYVDVTYYEDPYSSNCGIELDYYKESDLGVGHHFSRNFPNSLGLPKKYEDVADELKEFYKKVKTENFANTKKKFSN